MMKKVILPRVHPANRQHEGLNTMNVSTVIDALKSYNDDGTVGLSNRDPVVAVLGSYDENDVEFTAIAASPHPTLPDAAMNVGDLISALEGHRAEATLSTGQDGSGEIIGVFPSLGDGDHRFDVVLVVDR